MFHFSTKEIKNALEVKLEGDLDIDGTEVVEDQLIPQLEKYRVISINFENVPFVDSSGIGLLMHLVQALQDKGIHVSIFNVKQDVQEIFDLLQLPEILGEEIFI
ncbi:STAS domain-containing protein [Aquibacillus sp. 3ASR75-11]|uniref:Anti-sigma factor antagonist n=1 Tax=Terrihalobacillus insolitus TaxID=2950438 RepID=A0A9X4APT3_9BACI|nr:STAS domain-containing protein [Terrihalobacillus insolitus]MDC3425888.1 STAS domain-containing protein [Terrihalobacillus insolitus]